MRRLLDIARSWLAEPDDERPAAWIDLGAAARLTARTATLIAVFLLVGRFAAGACRLSDAALRSDSILRACAADARPITLFGVALFLGLVVFVPSIRGRWGQFEGGRLLRLFVGALALILAWAGSSYAYNAWYDHLHGTDRLILVALAGLVFWRPVFVLPFVAVYWTVMWQFDSPALGFYILIAEFRPLVSVLTMFGGALLVQATLGGRRMTTFLYLTLCIVAANFWVPGLAKLQLGWLGHGHVYLLLPNAYTHGWLGFLSPETISTVTRTLANADWPMRLGAITIECAALFFLASTRVTKLLLVLSSILLGNFFLTIGYLFWKWLALHAAVWLLLFSWTDAVRDEWRRRLFTAQRFALSVFVIGLSGTWLHPAALAWFDTPLTSTLAFEGVGRSGATYELPPAFFAPYESHLAMAHVVLALTPVPLLASRYGVTGDRTIAAALVGARTPAAVERLEEEAAKHSAVQVDAAVARQFDEFLTRTIAVSNRWLDRGVPLWVRLLAVVRAPPFLWTFPHGRAYGREEPIAAVRVYRVSSFFDGSRYAVFRRELLRTVVAP